MLGDGQIRSDQVRLVKFMTRPGQDQVKVMVSFKSCHGKVKISSRSDQSQGHSQVNIRSRLGTN